MVAPMAWLTGSLVLVAGIVASGLADRLGRGMALAAGIAAAMLTASALGLVLLDLNALRRLPLLGGMLLSAVIWTLVVVGLRANWPVRPRVATERGVRAGRWALALVLLVGAGIRLDPSPYLHGGQDQGLYVNVGHHIARTGRLRPVDRLMAGRVPGVDPEKIRKAHRIRPVEDDSPLRGVREGRWIAGLHVEDAQQGRLVPGFFHLLPVWFAMTELDLGFGRSTWCLVLFAWLSQLAAFGVGYRLAAGVDPDADARRRGWAVGLIAAAGLALHPLDLWISSFTVSENLARLSLLGTVALGLEATAAERRGAPGAELLAGLAGLSFAAGAFCRGSMLALAIVLAGGLSLVRRQTPRSRWIVLVSLVLGTTLAACQAIVHSWPYFFSAASTHFHVPRIRPFIAEAVLWAMAAGVTVLVVDGIGGAARRRWGWLDRTDGLLRGLALLLSVGALAAVVARSMLGVSEHGPSQQVASALLRYCGPVGLGMGVVGLLLAAWRADSWRQPWVLLAATIALLAGLKEAVRYEFYFARYLVADAIPVLVIAGAWLLVAAAGRLGRGRPRWAAMGLGIMLMAWHGPGLWRIRAPVFWTRDLSHADEDLSDLFARVPDDAVLMFDARAPGRWRGILATPALLSFDRAVLVYPNGRFVERAVVTGTPVYMISGGWEAEDRQRWPNDGPWRTEVVARGYYRALRAEVVEGAMPRGFTEWGGPWELHRIDRSIWRGTGAFSLYPGSHFVASVGPSSMTTEPVDLRWEPGAAVELHVAEGALEGCRVGVTLEGEEHRPLLPLLDERPNVRRFEMPAPSEEPRRAAIVVRWTCATARALDWRRLSMRWERRPADRVP